MLIVPLIIQMYFKHYGNVVFLMKKRKLFFLINAVYWTADDLNHMRYIRFMKKKCFVVRRHLACRRELAEGEHSFRAACESNIHRRFASLFHIAFSVERTWSVVLPVCCSSSDCRNLKKKVPAVLAQHEKICNVFAFLLFYHFSFPMNRGTE